MYKNRSVSSCKVLKNINNLNPKFNTIRPLKSKKPPAKCIELRHLEAELGVERYKNRLLAEEIQMHKGKIGKSLKYDRVLNELKNDFDHLSVSVRRSKIIQDQQKQEIDYLKGVLRSIKN